MSIDQAKQQAVGVQEQLNIAAANYEEAQRHHGQAAGVMAEVLDALHAHAQSLKWHIPVSNVVLHTAVAQEAAYEALNRAVGLASSNTAYTCSTSAIGQVADSHEVFNGLRDPERLW